MADIHIDDFYKDAAVTLLRLYATFPRKIILYVEDICGPDTPDEFGLPSDRFLAGFSAMIWLAEEGYLRFDATIKQEALDQAVLTEKALLLLASRSELAVDPATPELSSADEELPASVMAWSQININQLRRAVRSGSSFQINQCMNYLLTLSRH